MKKLSLILIVISLQACGITNNTTTETPQASIISQQTSFSEEDKSKYNFEVIKFLSGENSFDEKYMVNTISLDEADSMDGFSVKETEEYFCDNAYYFKIDGYLYRFQLNEQGQIESYIKYNVEA